MTANVFMTFWREEGRGVLLAIGVGLIGYLIKTIAQSPIADPLLISLILGIISHPFLKSKGGSSARFSLAMKIFIPAGIIFYAMKNMNFIEVEKVSPAMIALLIVIIIVYFASILITGRILGQKKEITYLVATGSAICGASAIAIMSPAIDAEPDDVSISLLSVTVAALVGLFVILPFLATLTGITNKVYALLSGAVLQYTGFVQVAAVSGSVPLKAELSVAAAKSLALLIKSARYLGLLIAVPFFSSLAKKRISLPLSLWLFLGAGIVGTSICFYSPVFFSKTLVPSVTTVYYILWSIAMAAIGLNADVRELLTNNGAKALIMAFVGFLAATITFFVGQFIIGLF